MAHPRLAHDRRVRRLGSRRHDDAADDDGRTADQDPLLPLRRTHPGHHHDATGGRDHATARDHDAGAHPRDDRAARDHDAARGPRDDHAAGDHDAAHGPGNDHAAGDHLRDAPACRRRPRGHQRSAKEGCMTRDIVAMIDAVLAEGEPEDHGISGDQACPWCGHDWHGLPCDPDASWLGRDLFDCRCDSSLPRPDDTWRPRVTPYPRGRVLERMHTEGIDGWSATAPIVRHRPDPAHTHGCARSPEETFAAIRDIGAAWVSVLGRVADAFGSVPAEAFLSVHHSARRSGARLREDHNHIHIAFDGVSPDVLALFYGGGDLRPLLPEVPPVTREERMARALDARRHRNTGPPRPTAGQARRPRGHAPRTATNPTACDRPTSRRTP